MGNPLDLAAELQKIYDSEINVRVSWLWDCGIDVWLGDEVNGYVAEETVPDASEIVPWLREAIAHFCPASTYAASLSPEIRDRAAVRLFRAPRIGARVNCPHCGAPNAVTGMVSALAREMILLCSPRMSNTTPNRWRICPRARAYSCHVANPRKAGRLYLRM
jgi:hypothetical protein